MFVFLVLGLLNLQALHKNKYKDLSDKNCVRLLSQKGSRGKILDRQGNAIADNKISYDVMILPQELTGSKNKQRPVSQNSLGSYKEWLLKELARILEVNVKELKEAFKNGYIGSSSPIVIAKNIDIKKAIALEEARLNLPAVIIQPNPKRAYPYGKLAAHVIGYVNEIDRWRLTKLADYGYKTKDIVGFGGLEEKYDYYLRQEEGGLSVEVNHKGRLTRILGFQPPRNGRNIQLTLDLKIQKIVEEKIAERKGCVILMDPYSGEIIAMASSPSFSPSAFTDKSSSLNSLFNNPDSPLLNRAVSCGYPAGSLFKLIVAAAGLETKKINSATSFLCEGGTLIGKQKFACWSTHDHQNLIAAIAHSCNVFFYKTGQLLGGQTIYDYALKFGLAKPTSIELPYETGGFIPSPLWQRIYKFRNWFDGDTANLSIGQGEVLVTPLQMARLMAVFANQGCLVTPYIVKSIDGHDISSQQKKAVSLPIKSDTLDYVRQGLRAVVSDSAGTANVLSGLSVPVAGKTGTAQAPPGQPHAWFAGFFPFKNPKFVICVLLERGGPGYVSCVLAKEIIQEMTDEGLI